MRILKLKLRGAIGIKKGLGVDEVEIDFTNFSAGLVALTGRNGSGKTTIMENLHPYRQMVSREGSLQQHFFLKDSHRILTFELDGKIYQSRILIDGLTGKSEAYLFRVRINLSGENPEELEAINDGKPTTYDIEIEKLLGSPQLFFNSVFSGQKSKGIAELTAGDRRKLFYELLNLDSYEVYLERAKQGLKSNETSLASIEGEIKALQNDGLSIEVLDQQRIDHLNYQAQLVSDISDLECKIVDAQENISKNEVELRLAQDKAERNVKIDADRKQIEASIQDLTAAHNRKIVGYNNDISLEKTKLERNQKLASPESKEKIEQALNDKKEHQTKLDEFKAEQSKLDKEYSEFQKEYSVMLKGLGSFERNVTTTEKRKAELIGLIDKLSTSINGAEENSSLISSVPCDESTGSSCKFLANAYTSKKNLEPLKKELEGLQFELKSVDSGLTGYINILEQQKQAAEEFLQTNEKKFDTLIGHNKTQIRLLEQSIANLNQHNYEKLLEEQKEAENNIKLIEQSIAGIEKLIVEARDSFFQSVNQMRTQLDDLNHRYDETVLVKIEELNTSLAFKKQILLGLQQGLQSSRARLDNEKQEVAKLDQLIITVKENDSKIEKLKDEKIAVENEIKDWTLLTKAFDKTGIPVLKLENSGIEITAIANELLSIFENKFRIVFETTKLKADKKNYKESFDINIVEDDGVCEISNKSGGQQVWLETAIQLAISLVVRNQGRNIQTAFLDEKDGALDLDNAFSYIEMLRKAHQMSGVYNTFIITHRPELLDFIPQQVKLRDGVLEVVS